MNAAYFVVYAASVIGALALGIVIGYIMAARQIKRLLSGIASMGEYLQGGKK